MIFLEICCFVLLQKVIKLVLVGMLLMFVLFLVIVVDLFFDIEILQLLDILFGLFFNDVQNVKFFFDQKIFVDVIFNSDLFMIFVDYCMQWNQFGFDLCYFVDVNFILLKVGEKYVLFVGQLLCEYIDGLWLVLICLIKNVKKWDLFLLLFEFYVVLGG